jgi:hypothetical protein
MDRPSHKEIDRKIKQAKEAVLENRLSLIDAASIAADALELGYMVSEISDILVDLLTEITPKEYVGKSPPQRSYEEKILQCELFPFKWVSKRLGCAVYMKFAFKDEQLWLVSFHEDRKEGGEK